MKMPSRIASLLVAVLFLGAGCMSKPIAESPGPQNPTPAPEPPKPEMTFTGCSPKAITVLEPAVGATVTLPIKVKAVVNNGEHSDCRWSVFEAVAGPMRLLDKDGVTVGVGRLEATGDWMTDKPVEFTGEIPNLALVEGAATLVLTEDNAKGDPDPQEVMIPLTVTR